MWKLQPSIYVRRHKEPDTTRLGVGTGNWSLAIQHRKYWAPYSDVSVTLMAALASSNSNWRHGPGCVCWLKHRRQHADQKAVFHSDISLPLSKNINFHLYLTRIVFWTLSKASCAHSLPSQVIFFLQDLQTTLATPVQEQQTVSRSSEPEQFNSQPNFINVNKHVTLASNSLPTCYKVCESRRYCVCVCESHQDHYGCVRLSDRCEGHPMVEESGEWPYCRLLPQAAAAGHYCRLLLQATATATFLKPSYIFSIFHFIYLFFFHTFPTCRTNRRSLGILQRSIVLSLFPVAKLPAVCGPVRQKKDVSIDNTMQHSSKIRWQYSSKWD